MRETSEKIETRMKLEREKEKNEKELRKKVRDYLSENLHVLNELSYLVHENRDKRFHEIYSEYVQSLIDNDLLR